MRIRIRISAANCRKIHWTKTLQTYFKMVKFYLTQIVYLRIKIQVIYHIVAVMLILAIIDEILI